MSQISDDEKTKINILLAEYNTLRSEAIARGGHLFNLVAFAAVAVTFWISTFLAWLDNIGDDRGVYFWAGAILLSVVLVAAIAAVVALSFTIRWDLEKAVARVAEIELDINCRVGDDLLIWENLCGGRVTSYWGGACHPRDTLGRRTPPQRSNYCAAFAPAQKPS